MNRIRQMRKLEPNESFVIGKGWRGAPPADGELICFANDSPKMYWN
jgi:hypothetical protein